jgi:hypothetical protein
MTNTLDEKGVDVLADVDARLLSFIATRDRRIAKSQPWSPTPIADNFRELLDRGEVVVGGRTTCGKHTDASWEVYTLWNEVVCKARKLGIHIQAEGIKHGNAWATKAGGFWDEKRYTFARATGAAA